MNPPPIVGGLRYNNIIVGMLPANGIPTASSRDHMASARAELYWIEGLGSRRQVQIHVAAVKTNESAIVFLTLR